MEAVNNFLSLIEHEKAHNEFGLSHIYNKLAAEEKEKGILEFVGCFIVETKLYYERKDEIERKRLNDFIKTLELHYQNIKDEIEESERLKPYD